MKILKTWTLGMGALLALIVAVAYAQPIFSNNLFLLGGNAGVTPQIQALGTDTNISINFVPKGTGTVQVNGTAIPGIAGGAGSFTTLSVSGAATFNGLQQVLIGGVLHQDGGIALFHNITDSATVDTNPDTLYTFSMPGNSLSVVGSYVHVRTYASVGATATNKQLQVKFGATTISDSTSTNFASGALMWVDCYVYMTGAATQKAVCYGSDGISGALTGGASGNWWKGISTPAETLSGTVAITVVGTTATAGNMTGRAMSVTWFPNGQ